MAFFTAQPLAPVGQGDDAQVGAARGRLGGQAGGGVVAAVVGHQDLPGVGAGVQVVDDLPQGGADAGLLVVGGDDHRQEGVSHGAGPVRGVGGSIVPLILTFSHQGRRDLRGVAARGPVRGEALEPDERGWGRRGALRELQGERGWRGGFRSS